jgi:hypothetical protein
LSGYCEETRGCDGVGHGVWTDWMIMRPFGRIYGMLDLGQGQPGFDCLAEGL